MATKKVTREERVCDFCDKNEAWQKCRLCGKDVCSNCEETECVQYPHAVYVSGSGDGIYCLPCDAKARRSGDPVHAAYLAIQRLRDERAGWGADFQERHERAEAELKKLTGGR